MEKIRAAPDVPGCYLYKDKAGYVIYVGKAKVLRNRVRSYFRATEDEKVQRLVQQITDVEYFLTETETDALLHEYRLIKQYKPWFNAQLKRDTPHPLIKLDRKGPYASLSIVPERDDDDAQYFGCFHDEQDAKDTLVLLGRTWKTPTCGKAGFGSPARACLNHHIGACMAPCEGRADPEAYAQAIADIARLFEGKRAHRPAQLRQEMQAHAQAMAYEKAGEAKLLLEDLERLQRKARRMLHYPTKGAVLVFFRAWREAGFTLFLVRDSVVRAQARFAEGLVAEGITQFLENAVASTPPDPAWLADAVREVYADKLFVPLPARCNAAQMEKAIYKHYPAFCR